MSSEGGNAEDVAVPHEEPISSQQNAEGTPYQSLALVESHLGSESPVEVEKQVDELEEEKAFSPEVPDEDLGANPDEGNDEFNPYEGEVGEEGGERKKKHRHRHHHRHKHKHRRKHREGSGEEVEGENPEGENISGKRKKKRSEGGSRKTRISKKEQENDLERQQRIDEQVDRLVSKIFKAAQSDRENKAEGNIAMEKLKLLPEIKSELKKVHYHEPFLSKGGLEALSLWVQRHEDGSYPCLAILEGVIDICDELPITTDNLLEGGRDLARSVKEIALTNESDQLRVKAKRLMEKWSRGIYGIDTDYHNLSEKEHGYVQFLRHINANRGKKPTAEQPKGTADFEEVKAGPQRVNKTEYPVRGTLAAMSKVGFDFIQRPASELVINKKKQESNLTPLMRRMIQVKREGRKKVAGSNKPKEFIQMMD
eukprot:TRINITY_DN105149_c4_g1_i1.p2 TRINITY_DN105149_c4_g1~~TRINITY_DN105149_c4_g1_i1.p2  ORF type:complete len:464 (+),score=66.26 TRINITY_DN105149_c4_g1_i1:119-1393(+)